MLRILITSNDTGVGKTQVTAALGRHFSNAGKSVSIIKPVETGVDVRNPQDAYKAADLAGIDRASAYTLRTYPQPIAPVSAARLNGDSMKLKGLLEAYHGVPATDVHLIEGAGGIAVPIDEDQCLDWADFAVGAGVDCVLIVVENRLGAINQSRMAAQYASAKGLSPYLCLNTLSPVDVALNQSHMEYFKAGEWPLLATLDAHSIELHFISQPWTD